MEAGHLPDERELEPLRQALSALGEPHRFRIALLLREAPLSVGEIVRQTGLPQPLVSHHLAILVRAGILDAERHGRRRVYAIAETTDRATAVLVGLIRPDAALDAAPAAAASTAPPRPRRRNDLEDYLL